MFSTKRLLEPVERTSLKFDISRQIANAKDWDELTSVIVRIPSVFIPVSDTRLLIPDDHGKIKVASEWTSGDDSLPCPSLTQTAQVCESCAMARKKEAISLAPCTHQSRIPSSEQLNSYCLPLLHINSLVGTLHFCVPSDVSITDTQMEILSSVASDMAFALENAQLQQLNLRQAEITLAEKNRIFRRLHDTIGQNISFLHLKLDQYSNKDDLASISEIHQDIERMRDIANQAYTQMREMLSDLNPETLTDLVAALRSRIQSVAERANFKFTLNIAGEPVNVPQFIKRHVLFICYETLNNVERHAGATNVSMELLWENRGLTITIVDDGIGLDHESVIAGEHFGLTIMEDRAQAINGKLTLEALPGKGTRMTLWVPL